MLRQSLAALLLCGLAGSGCRAAPLWPLWEKYASRFVDAQGRVIDHGALDRTTTEGQAYAMFFALVANDRARFDKLVDWTEANLAQGDLSAHLPAWSWGKAPDGSWKVLDANPAADADLWMAYALEEAGRLWQNDRYEKLGSVMASRVAQQEVVLVPGVGTTLIPGAQGFHPSADTWYLNPSYLPPSLLAYFAHRDPHAPWSQVLASMPAVVATENGWAMDWMRAGAGGLQPSARPGTLQGGETAGAAMGSYDAIRVYLWLGLADPKTPGVHEALYNTRGMALYLQTHDAPPTQVAANGKIVTGEGPPGFSAAVIPYLHALGLDALVKVQTDRLMLSQDAATGLFGAEPAYYNQNLAMFETGWAERRYKFEVDGRLKLAWK